MNKKEIDIEELKREMHNLETVINEKIDERNRLYAETQNGNNLSEEELAFKLENIIQLQKEKIELEKKWKKTFAQIVGHYQMPLVSKLRDLYLSDKKGYSNGLDLSASDLVSAIDKATVNIIDSSTVPDRLAEGETFSQYIDYENVTWKNLKDYTNAISNYDKFLMNRYEQELAIVRGDKAKIVETYLKDHEIENDGEEFVTKSGTKVMLKDAPVFDDPIKISNAKTMSIGKSSLQKIKNKFSSIKKKIKNKILTYLLDGKTVSIDSPQKLVDVIKSEEEKEQQHENINEQPELIPPTDIKPIKAENLPEETKKRFDEIHNQIEKRKNVRKEIEERKKAKETVIEEPTKDENTVRIEKAQERQTALRAGIEALRKDVNSYEGVSAFGLTDEETKEIERKRENMKSLENQLDVALQDEKDAFEIRRQEKIDADKKARQERIDNLNEQAALQEAKDVLSHLQVGVSHYGDEQMNNNSAPQYYDINGLTDEEIKETYNQIKNMPDMADRLSKAREEAKSDTQAMEQNDVTITDTPQITADAMSNVETTPIVPEENMDLEENQQEKQEQSEPTQETVDPVNNGTLDYSFAFGDMVEPNQSEMPTEPINSVDNTVEQPENAELATPTATEVANNLTPDMVSHYQSVMTAFQNNPESYEYQNAANILDAYNALQIEADKQSAIDNLHQNVR